MIGQAGPRSLAGVVAGALAGVRVAVVLLLAGLAGCAGDYVSGGSGSPAEEATGEGGYFKVGKPYQVRGQWYTPNADYGYDRTGLASYYGRKFHGKRTANGERFDMYAMTAAHKTLPMPSYVEVENLSNGRKVVLRVNDRGPFVSGRIIDVSRRAAKELGFIDQGTTEVRVRILRNQSLAAARAVGGSPVVRPVAFAPSEPTVAAKPPSFDNSLGRAYVQAGAFADAANADRVKQMIRPAGNAAIIKGISAGREVYRVRLGPLASRAAAERLAASIRQRWQQLEPHVIVEN